MKRRLVLLAMTMVTAWSLWAMAQAKHNGVPGQHPAPPGVHAAAPSVREGEHTAEGAAAHHEESEEPGPINWTGFGGATPPYLAMFINFAILAAAYYLLGKKPIAGALQARRDSIAREIEEARRMKAEAEARAKVYQAKLDALEQEVRTAREGLIRAGEAERDRIIADAEAKAERMRKDAEFLVGQELKQIRQDLLKDSVEAAVFAAEELLRKRVTAADQERLAEDYLADLGGRRGAHEVAGASRREAGEPS